METEQEHERAVLAIVDVDVWRVLAHAMHI